MKLDSPFGNAGVRGPDRHGKRKIQRNNVGKKKAAVKSTAADDDAAVEIQMKRNPTTNGRRGDRGPTDKNE